MPYRNVLALAVAALSAVPAAAQELQTPSEWRWIADAPARLVTTQEVADSAWRFVAMPPGWHVTTGPGVLLFHPGYEGRERFTLEAELFLFPGESQAEYGVFVGGLRLDDPGRQYTAFVLRRDGAAAVVGRSGAGERVLLPWRVNEAVVPHTGSGTAKNVITLHVEPAAVRFVVNGGEVGTLPHDALATGGGIGFRIGTGVNLHASRLDLTHHLAPPGKDQ
jgi:hypothetical protein